MSDITPHDHMCGIFHDDADQAAVVAEFVLTGIANNEKVCVYDTEQSKGINTMVIAILKKAIDLDKYVRSKQVTFGDFLSAYQPAPHETGSLSDTLFKRT